MLDNPENQGSENQVSADKSAALKGAPSVENCKISQLPDGCKDVVSIRGTENGLVLRIDGRTEWSEIISLVTQVFASQEKFFAGGHVSIEWLEKLPAKEQSEELEALLKSRFNVDILRPKPKLAAKRERKTGGLETEAGLKSENSLKKNVLSPAISLFDGSIFRPVAAEKLAVPPNRSNVSASTSGGNVIDKLESAKNNASNTQYLTSTAQESPLPQSFSSQEVDKISAILGDDLFYEDDANAKIVFGTVRSGQKIETPFSLIVVGDVNPGSDLIAGGDIIVIGSLRGTAHAAAYDEEALHRVILALQMQPVQLRIGSVISRGNNDVVRGAEIARIESRRIVVEAYNPRGFIWKRGRAKVNS